MDSPALFRTVVALAAIVALAFGLVNGYAAPPPKPPPKPPDASSIQQYVEAVPTASGGRAVGVGKAVSRRLPPRSERALERIGGRATQGLRLIATSSAYGAPVGLLKRGGATKANGRGLAAAVGAATGGGGGRGLELLGLLLVVITAGLVAAAYMKRRP